MRSSQLSWQAPSSGIDCATTFDKTIVASPQFLNSADRTSRNEPAPGNAADENFKMIMNRTHDLKERAPRFDRSRITRRTFLRGVGVAMALPWLESIPVWGVAPATEGAPGAFPKRFAALFMGNGINSEHWWAKGSGAEMELGKSLQPMAPLKTEDFEGEGGRKRPGSWQGHL